jgi:hypothetical protein
MVSVSNSLYILHFKISKNILLTVILQQLLEEVSYNIQYIS